jgi:hypothetical protein
MEIVIIKTKSKKVTKFLELLCEELNLRYRMLNQKPTEDFFHAASSKKGAKSKTASKKKSLKDLR